jgi:hypothetical protein
VVYVAKKEQHDVQAHDTRTEEEQLKLDTLQEILHNGGDISQSMVNSLARQLQAGQIALYVSVGNAFELKCGFALSSQESKRHVYANGEGLVGRVAEEGTTLYIDILPTGYITVFSGLGAASPSYLAIVPLKHENEVRGILELATFVPLAANTILQLEKIGRTWAQTCL